MQSAQNGSTSAVPRQATALPIRDLSAAARLEELSGGQFAPELLESLSRGLFRSTRSVVDVKDDWKRIFGETHQ